MTWQTHYLVFPSEAAAIAALPFARYTDIDDVEKWRSGEEQWAIDVIGMSQRPTGNTVTVSLADGQKIDVPEYEETTDFLVNIRCTPTFARRTVMKAVQDVRVHPANPKRVFA